MGSTYASAVSVARSGQSPCPAVTRSRPHSPSPMLIPRADQLAGYARSLNIGALDGAARAGRGGTRRAGRGGTRWTGRHALDGATHAALDRAAHAALDGAAPAVPAVRRPRARCRRRPVVE